jgi:hypothetical protein
VADQFIFANSYNPQVAGSILQKNRASGWPLGDRYRNPRTRMALSEITCS